MASVKRSLPLPTVLFLNFGGLMVLGLAYG